MWKGVKTKTINMTGIRKKRACQLERTTKERTEILCLAATNGRKIPLLKKSFNNLCIVSSRVAFIPVQPHIFSWVGEKNFWPRERTISSERATERGLDFVTHNGTRNFCGNRSLALALSFQSRLKGKFSMEMSRPISLQNRCKFETRDAKQVDSESDDD